MWVKPRLFKDLSKPPGLLSNKVMTFARGLTVKTFENKPDHSEHTQWTSLCKQPSAQSHFNSGISPSELSSCELSISLHSLAFLALLLLSSTKSLPGSCLTSSPTLMHRSSSLRDSHAHKNRKKKKTKKQQKGSTFPPEEFVMQMIRWFHLHRKSKCCLCPFF